MLLIVNANEWAAEISVARCTEHCRGGQAKTAAAIGRWRNVTADEDRR